MTSRPSGSKPGSIDCRLTRLRTKSAMVTSSTTERATWPTTRRLRPCRRGRPATSDPSLRAEETSRREAWRPGARPKSSPVATETATAKVRTVRSGRTSTTSGCREVLTTSSTTQPDTRSPRRPPARAIATLSISTSRSNRPRLDPSARRMPISRRRDAARVRNRPARLAQAITNTRRTTPIKSDKTVSTRSRAAGEKAK